MGKLFDLIEVGYLVFNTPFLIAFGVLTLNPDYYKPCDTNSNVYYWSLLAFIFFAFNVLSSLIFVQILSVWPNKSYNYYTDRNIMYAITFLRVLAIILILISFCGLCYANANANESCGNLSSLVLAYIIIISISIGVSFLMLCCLCFSKNCKGLFMVQ